MLTHQDTTGLGSYALFSEENQETNRFIQLRTDAFDRVFSPSESGAGALANFLCYVHLITDAGWPRWRTETFSVASVEQSIRLPYRRARWSIHRLLSLGLIDVELRRFQPTVLTVCDPLAAGHVLHDAARVETFRQLSVRELRGLLDSTLSWDAKAMFVGLLIAADAETGAYYSSFTAVRKRFSIGYLRCQRIIAELVTRGYLSLQRRLRDTRFEIAEMSRYLVAPRSERDMECRVLASEISVRYAIAFTPQLVGILKRCLAGGMTSQEILRWLDVQGPLTGAKSPTAVVVSRLTRLNRDLKRSSHRRAQQAAPQGVHSLTTVDVDVAPTTPRLLQDLDRTDYDRFVRFISNTLPVLPDPSTLGLSHHMSQRYKLCAAAVEAACWRTVADTDTDEDADHAYLLRNWAHQVDPEHCPPPSVVSSATRWQDSTADNLAETIASRYAELIH